MSYDTLQPVSEERIERFSKRFELLAIETTLVVAPEATIGAQTFASDTVTALDQTIAAPLSSSSPPGVETAETDPDVLPRISLGGTGASARDASPGSVRADLELGKTLGEGGMGKVHEAKQRSLRRRVAVKTLKKNATKESHQALLSEARVTGFLDHPRIVPVHNLGLDDAGKPVLVMKCVQGVPWSELLDTHDHPAWEYWLARHGDRLLVHLEVLSQVCDALHFAHSKGIVHRDIKPENVMLGGFGEVYLLDWGLAVRDPSEAVGQLVGTPAFMAPEMAMGEAVDARTDVYLLGASLHQVLTGAFLHQGETLRSVLSSAVLSARFEYPESVPAELATLADSATRRSAAERPQSAEEVRQAISQYLRHRGSIKASDAAADKLSQGEVLYQTTLAQEVAANDESIQEAPLAPEELAFHLATHCAEARFGFEQALDAWPDNEAAKSGFARCLELLVEVHLIRRDPVGASAQLALMDVPPKALEDKIIALRRHLNEESKEREHLHRIKEDLDEEKGQRTRVKVYLLLVACVLAVSLYVGLAGRRTDIRHHELVLIPFGFLVIAGAITFVKRQTLLSNAYSRRMVLLVNVALFALLINRLVAWKLSLPLQQVFAVDQLLLAVITAVGGIALSSWMSPMSLVFVIGTAVTVYCDPSLASTLFSAATGVGLLVGALAWTQRSR